MENNQNLENGEALVATSPITVAEESNTTETYTTEETYNYEDELRNAIRERAKKDMLFGALWCIGGTALTIAQIGYIFWGAIIFGGIQFFRGVSNYNKA